MMNLQFCLDKKKVRALVVDWKTKCRLNNTIIKHFVFIKWPMGFELLYFTNLIIITSSWSNFALSVSFHILDPDNCTWINIKKRSKTEPSDYKSFLFNWFFYYSFNFFFLFSFRYMKYLYPFECNNEKLSDPAELQAAIEGNRREGRRPSYG